MLRPPAIIRISEITIAVTGWWMKYFATARLLF